MKEVLISRLNWLMVEKRYDFVVSTRKIVHVWIAPGTAINLMFACLPHMFSTFLGGKSTDNEIFLFARVGYIKQIYRLVLHLHAIVKHFCLVPMPIHHLQNYDQSYSATMILEP